MISNYRMVRKYQSCNDLKHKSSSLYFQLRNKRNIFRFKVWARDSGLPQLNVSVTVHVHIINLNDHDPIFTEKSYNVSIDENSPNGTVLMQVKAIDKDAGEYGEVEYELTGEHSQNFHIDVKTGEITVANSNFLDHEKITECVLQVVGKKSYRYFYATLKLFNNFF